MGSAVEMGIRFRKFLVVSVRTCYRSARNYPFLFGLLCVLILLYRSFPFLFSFLVSASPVLICTAVLLGTLLSFGQPNIPEIEIEEKVSRDVASFRSGILDNDSVVAKVGDSFTVERFDGDVGSFEEKRKSTKLDEHSDVVDFVPVIHEHDREIRFERGGVEEFEKGKVEEFEPDEVVESAKVEVEVAATTERELHSTELDERREIFERDFDIKSLATDGENAVENKVMADQSMRNEICEVEDRNISIEPFFKEDHLKLSLDDKGDSDVNDRDSSGSESDRAESSSPDASMADIIPLLDELDPLLDSETPLPAHRSIEESDASSEQSHKSDDDCVISDDEAENQGEDGAAVEHDDDDDDDDGMRDEKEDESKSAIKWTEDDQKNLMDLGSLELERNQRLENLIARRRARNNLRMLAGKNLIDFDGIDLPVNVPPISTAKRNPFDLPYDSYNNMGLPPIPGSAPSILLPRRNPFDLPYDSNEEKPDLKSDEFEQEFLSLQHKDIFRRHESFSVGPSNFAVPRPEQHDIRWKPYFMPEKIAAEGTSYSPLERQFSEVSESKLSSVSDSESTSSIADQDDKKPDESQSFLETTTVSYLDPTSSSIEHGNRSWEDMGSEDYVEENRDVHHEVIEITLGSTESHLESQSGSSETGAADTPVETNASEIHSKSLLVETDFSSNSSICSLSDEINATPDEVRPSSPRVEDSSIETTGPSLPAALEENADFKITSEVLDDIQHQEPVYDSSPSAEGKDSNVHYGIEQDASSTSKDIPDASSELREVDKNEQESSEVSEIVREVTKAESPKHDTGSDAHNLSVAPQILVEHISVDSGPSANIAPIEKGIIDDIKEDKDRLASPENDIIDGIPKIEDGNLDSSPSSDQISFQSRAFTIPEDQLSSAVNHVQEDIGTTSDAKRIEMDGTLNNDENVELEQTKMSRSSSYDKSSVDEVTLQNDAICHTDQSDSSISNRGFRGSEIPAHDLDELIEITNSVAASHDQTTTNTIIPTSQEQKNAGAVEELDILVSSRATFPSESEQVEEQAILKSDKTIVESVIIHPDDAEEPAISSIDSAAEVISDNITPKVHQDISTALSSVESYSSSASPDHNLLSSYAGRDPKDGIVDQVVCEDREEVSRHLDYLAESYGSGFLEKMTREEVDEISDIDEGLLLELDEVGDFSVKEIVEPVLEKKIMPEKAQAERLGLGSSSNLTDDKLDIPILEARSLEDINLAFRQLHEGVDVEDVILPSSIESQIEEEAKPETSSDLELVEARSLGDIHVALMQNTISESGSRSEPPETKSDIPMLEVRSLDDINLAFRQLHEGVDVEDVILPSAIKSQVIEEAKPETSSGLEVVEARSLEDIHVALMQDSEINTDESGSSSKPTETKSDIPVLEARSLDDINLAFRQLREGVDVEDTILPSSLKIQVNEEAKPETSSELEVVEARSIGDIHVDLMQESENNVGESGSSSKMPETKSDIATLEARSLDGINSGFRQLHEGVDKEDVVLPSSIESQVNEAKPETSSELEVVEARSIGDIHVDLMQESENNVGESGSSSKMPETKSDIPTLKARSLDGINSGFRPLHEGADEEDVILPSSIESQVNEEAKHETSSDLEVVEARSLGDIHVALAQASENNIGESGSSSKLTETKSDTPTLEAKSLDDINLARQLDEVVDVEDTVLPSAVESQVREEAKPETSSDVALIELSENNKGEPGSTSNLFETKLDIPVLEAKSLDDINLAFRQLREGVDVEDVILPRDVKNQAEEEAKTETSSDLEVVEAKSLGDIHVAVKQVSEKNLSEPPGSSALNDPSKEKIEPAIVDSIIAISPSNTTDAVKPAADIVDEKPVDLNVSASGTIDNSDKPAADEKTVDPIVSAT